jgi:TPR repeat protein
MLMDSSLFLEIKKADEGDVEAQIKVANAFFEGEGLPAPNYLEAKKYMIMLADKAPDELPKIGYGTLLYFVGEACFLAGQKLEANEWFQRAHDYFQETYDDDFAAQLNEEYGLVKMIQKTAHHGSF